MLYERFLAEYPFSGRTARAKSSYALRATAMIQAGVEPDLVDDAGWYKADDFWLFALYVLVAYVALPPIALAARPRRCARPSGCGMASPCPSNESSRRAGDEGGDDVGGVTVQVGTRTQNLRIRDRVHESHPWSQSLTPCWSVSDVVSLVAPVSRGGGSHASGYARWRRAVDLEVGTVVGSITVRVCRGGA